MRLDDCRVVVVIVEATAVEATGEGGDQCVANALLGKLVWRVAARGSIGLFLGTGVR